MNNLAVIPCHNRLKVLQKSLETFFGNTNVVFDEILLINDNSNQQTSDWIDGWIEGAREEYPQTTFNLTHYKEKNRGYAYVFEQGFYYAKWRNPKYFFWCESDYIWRKDWAEDALFVLENSPKTVLITGYSHPHYHDPNMIESQKEMFHSKYGETFLGMNYMGNSFSISTKNKNILVQGITSSCCSGIINWNNFMKLVALDKDFWFNTIYSPVRKYPKRVSDGDYSQSIIKTWYDLNESTIEIERDFPILDICGDSIANHISGGNSLNCPGSVEGIAMEASPVWNIESSEKRQLIFRAALEDHNSGWGVVVNDLFDIVSQKYDVIPITLTVALGRYRDIVVKPTSRRDYEPLELMVCPVQIDEGMSIHKLTPDKRNRINFTMWETNKLSYYSINELNKMMSIIVPNYWNKRVFAEEGVTVPLHIVPLNIDTDTYQYKEPENDDVFVFGTANFDSRKNLYSVIKAFCRAFPTEKDVRLKIKLHPLNGEFDTKFIDKRIQIVIEDYSKEELRDWFHSIDCFVSASASEGWGLFQHEAMGCGRPLISVWFGGVKEYFNEDVGYVLPHEEVLAEGFWALSAGGTWAEFKEKDLINTMRYCYNNRDEVREKGKLSSERAVKFTRERTATELFKVLDKYSYAL